MSKVSADSGDRLGPGEPPLVKQELEWEPKEEAGLLHLFSSYFFPRNSSFQLEE